MNAPISPKAPETPILERQIFDCVIPYLERTDCHTMAGNVRSLWDSYDSLARELETAKAALNELPAADVTDEALCDAIRFYGSTAHLTTNAEELKKALLFRNTLSLLYAKLTPLRAALKPSNEVGTL